MRSVYLDYNATAPIAPEVARAMRPWLSSVPTNPASVHRFGRDARAAIEDARAALRDFCGNGEVVFTSGGTEADNLALNGVFGDSPGGHLVVSAIEHPAVIEPAARLRERGVAVTLVTADGEGRVDPDDVARALRPDTRLVSVMAANNETGTTQPIAEIVRRAHASGVPVHCDAVQAAAWVPLPDLLGDADMVSLSGHKLGGPPGVGALVLRRPVTLEPMLRGGGQQAGRRPGTEPTALLVGLGAAVERAASQRREQAPRVGALTERLVRAVVGSVDRARPTVPSAERLPNTAHICFAGCPGDALVARLDLEGIAVSAGSACHSGVAHASSVLDALGVAPDYALGAVRFSLGYPTTDDEIDRLLEVLPVAVDEVRRELADVGHARARA